ncbi:MAG: MBL fold metallo-hydrolase [Prevotellaceae bacterium]|nr:MBL fold metallo-hydrolase [Prevotellaceae bacterium]
MNITVKRFVLNPVGVNCYVVSDAKGTGVIIDPGACSREEFSEIRQYVEGEGIRLSHALLTHAHFDHVFGLDFVYETYGLKAECHALEEQIYQSNPDLALELCGTRLPLPRVGLDCTLTDGQEIACGELRFKVIHTPGHTPGGLCFYSESEGILFSGDTLFQGSLGRTDVPLGSWRQEKQSVREKLFTLPPETLVYPGHGPTTEIGYERMYNPYIK